jgi:cytochrome c nitrite reductase small subunit
MRRGPWVNQRATDEATRSIRSVRVLSVAIAIAVGIVGGVGAFTFVYGHGFSYLTTEPEVCANCHIMHGHYDSWVTSSHADLAVCTDCHLGKGLFRKWLTKIDNGFFHGLAFTTGHFHEPIRIKPRNRRITQRTCLGCHADLVESMLTAEHAGETLLCVHCHSDVGHSGRR